MEGGRIICPVNLEKRILSTLHKASVPCCGLLIGRWNEEDLMIISAYHSSTNDVDDIKYSMKEASGNFPGGLDICGMYFSYPPDTDEDSILRTVRQTCAVLKDQFSESSLLMVVHQRTSSLSDNVFWYHLDSREITPAPPFIQDDSLHSSFWQNLVTFRVKTTCQIIVPYHKDPEKLKRSVGVELALQIDAISSSKTAYKVDKSPILLHNQSEGFERAFSGLSAEQPCSEIFNLIDRGEEVKTRRKIKDYSQEIVNVSLLRCASPQDEKEKSAFFIYVDEEPTSYLTVKLPVDCVVLADCEDPVGNLPQLFTRTVIAQLTSLGRVICQFYQDKELPLVRAVHIKPLSWDHVITVYYPDNHTEDQLVEYRRSLQESFHLAVDRPLLRVSNQFMFPDQTSTLTYLQNTHLGLPKSGVEGGVVSCVSGVYSYHHYMQDNINDNGWGCAYRSLQTIVSWFRHQGYTKEPVPTHAQIQQALVDVGDKEAGFVGSRQWIGSTEVGFVLERLLNVQSRFLVVNAGRDLADKGRELAQHFNTQGTPIMIGGGVLAHTILGVDFNEQTGQVKFLILDPHYTGPEDLREIQSKGWCGWKGPEFWDQNAFYNLCLPQRPEMI